MEEQRKSGQFIAVVLLLMIALPVLYVLSIGPVDVYFSSTETRPWVVAFYSPLAWLADHSTVSKAWLLWYISLWE